MAEALKDNTCLETLECVVMMNLHRVICMVDWGGGVARCTPFSSPACACLDVCSPSLPAVLVCLHSLWDNSIGDEGAVALAEMLKHNTTLTGLE